MNDAPDFSPGYPSKGARLAPAWAVAWAKLSDGEWWTSRSLVEEMIKLAEPLQPKTCGALLRQASAVGLLERKQSTERGSRVSYRIATESGS